MHGVRAPVPRRQPAVRPGALHEGVWGRAVIPPAAGRAPRSTRQARLVCPHCGNCKKNLIEDNNASEKSVNYMRSSKKPPINTTHDIRKEFPELVGRIEHLSDELEELRSLIRFGDFKMTQQFLDVLAREAREISKWLAPNV